MLLESEHQRLAVGQVAVPFGICTEPSNVQAGGGASRFGSGAWAAGTSAPTPPICRSCGTTSTRCCVTANGSAPPPNSTTGPRRGNALRRRNHAAAAADPPRRTRPRHAQRKRPATDRGSRPDRARAPARPCTSAYPPHSRQHSIRTWKAQRDNTTHEPSDRRAAQRQRPPTPQSHRCPRPTTHRRRRDHRLRGRPHGRRRSLVFVSPPRPALPDPRPRRRTRTELASIRTSHRSLLADLANLRAHNERLRHQNTKLSERLSEVFGEQVFHDAGLTRTDESALSVSALPNSNNNSSTNARTSRTATTNSPPPAPPTAT